MKLAEAQLRELIEPVLALADTAGRRIMEIYGTEFTVQDKADRTPLTEADVAAHDTILEGLAPLTPELPILSEESGHVTYAERAQWRTYWLVDPLDGTREFIKRNGEFTVNIALIHEHEAVLGVVLAPALDHKYWAARGYGAYRSTSGGPTERICVRPLEPSSMVVAASRSHASRHLQGFLQRIEHHQVMYVGSALKTCLVACGQADVYGRFGPTSEWDTAAAQCVLEEAGGRVMDLNMCALRYNTRESVINPSFLAVGDATHEWERYLPPELTKNR